MLNFHIIKVTLKNKEVRYRAIVTRSGKAIHSKTSRRKADAKTYGARRVLEYQSYDANGTIPCNVTFNKLANEYVHAWTGKDHDCIRLVSWWTDHFRHLLLTDITPQLIREKLKPKKHQAPSTYNRHIVVLSSVMNFAVRQQQDDEITGQYISKNPCKEIQKLKVDNKRVRFLSDQERPRFLKAAKNIGGKFYLKVLMALSTGMRKGELEQLRWTDIDWQRGLALLHDTKNGTARHTPIPDVVLSHLKQYREIGDSLLFPSSINPGKPFDYKKQWTNCLKSADIQDFRWHDMRHDTASTLARDGKTLKEIAEILGHKSLASTDRYTHLCTEHKSQILNDTMNKAFNL